MLAMFKRFLVAVLSLFLVVGSAGAASASTHKAASHRSHIKPSAESWSHIKPSAESWSHIKPSAESWSSLRR